MTATSAGRGELTPQRASPPRPQRVDPGRVGGGARRAPLSLLGALALPLTLLGCGVEQAESDIADQQLCQAARAAAEASRDGQAAGGAVPSGRYDEAARALDDLAGRALDPELRDALADRARAYDDQRRAATGTATPGATADEAQEVLDRVCQRLSAF